jgi:hypothetical protein
MGRTEKRDLVETSKMRTERLQVEDGNILSYDPM